VDCVNHRCERVGGCGLELGMFGRGVQWEHSVYKRVDCLKGQRV
jgi:hypothetical protein